MVESRCLARLVRISIERSMNDPFSMLGCCVEQFVHVSRTCSTPSYAPAHAPRLSTGRGLKPGQCLSSATKCCGSRSLCIVSAPVPCCSWSGGCPCQTRTRRGWSTWIIGKTSLTRLQHDRGPRPPPLRTGSPTRPWSGNLGGLPPAKAGHCGDCPRPSTEEPLHGGYGKSIIYNFTQVTLVNSNLTICSRH